MEDAQVEYDEFGNAVEEEDGFGSASEESDFDEKDLVSAQSVDCSRSWCKAVLSNVCVCVCLWSVWPVSVHEGEVWGREQGPILPSILTLQRGVSLPRPTLTTTSCGSWSESAEKERRRPKITKSF